VAQRHRPVDSDCVHIVPAVFAIGWIAFFGYWVVAAFWMKRGRVPWGRELGIRVAVVIVAVVLVRTGALRHHHRTTAVWLIGVGFALFAIGLALAVWARIHIGRNWGTPMSQKADLELVTTGPYRLIRHPIYSGILLAGIGTAVGLTWSWLIVVGLAGVYFTYSAVVDERTLAARLPQTYPSYRSSTKMLVPFVF